jgi:hypothetical protein
MFPQEKSKSKTSISDLTTLIYGPSKIGKSTWCSYSDSALFLATEPGLNALEVYQISITKWEELLIAARDIANGQHQFKTIIIDTIDNAYKFCSEYVCNKFKVEHESDLGYGKGWALVNNEFSRVMTKLAFLPYGLIFVSHSTERDIETRTGKHTRIVPTLPDKARKFITGLVDLILYCDIDMLQQDDGSIVSSRVMYTKPNANYDAGDRTNLLPEKIPMDYKIFTSIFNVDAGVEDDANGKI